MDIFAYDFMRRAFLVGILLAAVIPCIGTIVVLKRLSMIGDALAHASLAGVAAGMLAGFNPVAGAVAASMAAALGIEAIRRKMPRYSETSIAIVMSAGIGLAGVLSGFGNVGSFSNFLFGSIVAISDLEMWMVIAASLCVALLFLLFFKELFLTAFDEHAARLAGVRVGLVNTLFTLLTAAVVSVAARTIGALIVSSLMVIPVTCAMQVAKSFRQTVAAGSLFAIGFTIAGLFLSYWFGLRPGATIVLIGCITLVVLLAAGRKAN